jgi:hypothetical protein
VTEETIWTIQPVVTYRCQFLISPLGANMTQRAIVAPQWRSRPLRAKRDPMGKVPREWRPSVRHSILKRSTLSVITPRGSKDQYHPKGPKFFP